jgi:hypothetical protein
LIIFFIAMTLWEWVTKCVAVEQRAMAHRHSAWCFVNWAL